MALTTPNMGLVSWDQASDPYDHNQLAANFNTIDSHDHTIGKGPRITTAAIQDAAVTNGKLANLAVTTSKIANDAVTAPKLDREYVHPVGSIMPWWRPSESTAIPEGWVIATGQTLAAGEHDFPGEGAVTLPDLRNRFLLGAATSNTGPNETDSPAIGYTGGKHTINIAHSHTVPSHDHTIEPHGHKVEAHSHNLDPHKHTLSNHRHVHFFPIANQVPVQGTNNDWGYRIMNPVDMEDFPPTFAYDGADGDELNFQMGLWPDVYYSPSIDTYTRYAGQSNRAPTQRYPMIAVDRLKNEHSPRLLDVTTAGVPYERFLTFASPPVDNDGKRVTYTGETAGTTQGSAPLTEATALTTNGKSLTTNQSGNVLDSRPQFIGVLYLIKVKNTI